MYTSRFKLFIIVILFCGINSIASTYIKGGLTFSNFQNVSDSSQPGKTMGIGWDWVFGKNSSIITFGFDLCYTERGGILKDRKIITNYYQSTVYLNSYDLNVKVGFIDVPLNASINIPIKEKLKLKLTFGKSLPIAINDKSKLKNEKLLMELDKGWEQDPEITELVDYVDAGESSLGSQKLKLSDWLYSISIEYSHIGFQIQYLNEGQYLSRVLNFTQLNEKMHSFNFILYLVL